MNNKNVLKTVFFLMIVTLIFVGYNSHQTTLAGDIFGMNEPVEGKDWRITVLSAKNIGTKFSETMSGVQTQKGYINNPNYYLLRVEVQLESLTKKAGALWDWKDFLTQVVVRDGTGNTYSYSAAGTRGSYINIMEKGKTQKAFQPIGTTAKLDYIFIVPDNVTIMDFVWPDLPPVRVEVK